MNPKAMNGKWYVAVQALLMCCLLFVVPPRCEAQGNLVPNHSFEEYDTCGVILGFYGPTDGPLHWFSASGSPDYYQGCVPNGSHNGVPQSYAAFQYPQDGASYIGMVTWQSVGLREYVMAQLTEPLVPSQTYYASFHANAAWNGSIANPSLYAASSHVGMLFTVLPRPWSIGDSYPLSGNFAHMYHPWVIADTVGWTLVSGSFVADSAYQYVMIGNHFSNAITDTVHFATYTWQPQAYTLIDNVCVSTDPLGCPLATGVLENAMKEVALFPNPATHELTVRGRAMDAAASVHDALGRVVWQGRITGETWRLDLSSWARGSYVLHMEQRNGHRTFKFVLIE